MTDRSVIVKQRSEAGWIVTSLLSGTIGTLDVVVASQRVGANDRANARPMTGLRDTPNLKR